VYLSGFGNYHQTEAEPGALPKNQNSPQQCPKGLYAEQLSGTAFTKPRHLNQFSWLYRKLPTVTQQDYRLYKTHAFSKLVENQPPVPMRWSPYPTPHLKFDFVDGLQLVAKNSTQSCFLYHCNQSMTNRYFSSFDGELLVVAYQGKLKCFTEFGRLDIEPGWIAVIPRGVKFKVEVEPEGAAGYLCENKGAPLKLPSLGAIVANGLANPRHFLYPVAAVENNNNKVEIICKYQDKLWSTTSHHSPLNVVAWHGNYAPYCYDLSLFNTINTVSFDHPDPSIFTVLTSESATPGIANLDFVIFPTRWMVAEHTFRPPYFHRNVMSEFMGLVKGQYDAKQDGFSVGGFSIHNCMSAHGPDLDTYKTASSKELKPEYYKDTLAFMFESCEPWLITESAFTHESRQHDYLACWDGFKSES
jgi:homogentisate 1,2-dioxygenase